MKDNIINSDIKEVDYQILKQIEENAKKYEQASDKKNFLKNVSAYEQKVILLNSERPYDVLMYLDELDLKSSRLVINELSQEEISKILDLFTSEDKKNFYKHFSDLSLVNEFIKYDNNSPEHIESLSFERKIDILESTKEETIEASSKVYESMSSVEQEKAIETITEAEASNVLSDVANNESISSEQNNLNNDIEIKNIESRSNENLIDNKFYLNNNKNLEEEPINNLDSNEEEPINNLNNNVEEVEEQEDLEQNDIEVNQEEIDSNDSIINQFEEAKKECEQQEIEMIKSQILIDNQKIMEKKI